MSLADDIRNLRDRSHADLNAAHDYYIHTKRAWRIIQQLASQGHSPAFENLATGNVVEDHQLPALAQKYVTQYLAPATFQQFVSLFENFVFDFLRLWLVAYPKSLSGKQLEFRMVLNSADKEEIVQLVVEKGLAELAYRRVDEWFGYLNRIVKIGRPNQDQIERLAEIKASRDVLVHNKGIVGSRYARKSMGRERFAPGEELVITEQYHRESWVLVKEVIADVADAAMQKAGNS